jgi:hypothetical protein
MPQRLIVGGGRRSAAAPGPRRPLLGDPVGAQFADHELAQRVIEIRRIIGAARRLLARIARILKGLFRNIFSDCATVMPSVCMPMDDSSRTSRSKASVIWPMCFLRIALAQALLVHHLLAVMRPALREGIPHPQPSSFEGLAFECRNCRKCPGHTSCTEVNSSVASLGM